MFTKLKTWWDRFTGKKPPGPPPPPPTYPPFSSPTTKP